MYRQSPRGRWEKQGIAGLPGWLEAGETGKYYASLCNISKRQKLKNCAGAGIKRYERREI